MNPLVAQIQVKVITGAKRTEIAEWMGDGSLKIKLHSKPIEGKANEELRNLLAKKLELPISCVEIISGIHARRKLVRFSGMEEETIKKKIQGEQRDQDP